VIGYCGKSEELTAQGQKAVLDSRCGTERARSRFGSDSGERVGNNGDEQVDEPKIEYDEANDKKEAGYEELRVDHLVHQRRPLVSYTNEVHE
jgi:hypothetical protein